MVGTATTIETARPATSAARERGHGHRQVAPEAGRRVPARPRSHGRGAAAGARAEARPPLTSPPARRERGGAGTAAGPRRPAGVPTTRARASAPGRGAARQGDGRRSPQPRPTRNDAGGRAAAADHGAVPRQAREAKHTGTRPGGRQTRRTGDRADEARLARPPPRRRGDDLAEDVAGGGGRAPTRGRPGGHPKGTDASRPPGHDTGSHRQRPPAQGRSRGTQDADWPPRPPNQGAPPRGARAHHRQTPTSRGQPRDNNTLPRAHRPPHVPRHTPPPPRPTPPPQGPPRPNTIAPTPVCDSPHTRKWGRRHTRRRPGHEVSPPHGTPWEDDGDEVAGPRPPPRERNRGKTPRPLPSRPPRESHSRDTPPRRRPRGARWEKGTTPPLGLAHLRDDLERSRGTTEDRASHAHAPAAGARRSGGTAPTDAGRTAREAHAKEAKRERLLRPRTTAPPTPPGPGERDITTSISQSREPGATRAPREEGHGEDPHRRSLLQPQPAPSPPLLSLLPSRATVADDPARRTPDTWHGACGLGSSQPPPGACGGEGESHGVEDPRTTSPRRPRVSQRPEAAPRVGSAGRTHESRRAGPSGRFKWQGPVRAPDGGPKPSALRASRVPEPPARDARGDRVSTYLVVKKAHFRRKKSRRPAAGPIHEPRGGSPGPRPGYLSPTLPHPQQPRSSLGAIWSTRAAGAAEWSGAGRENVAEAASGPGSPSPDRPREQYDSGRSPPPPPPRPGLAVEEGAGEGEKKSRPPTGTHVGPLKGRACTPNLKRQQEAPTPGRHRDSHRQRRPAPGTLPRARRPSHSPHEGRRSSRDKGQYKSGRQVAPDNGSNVPGPGSLSPAGHRGCSSAGPPKRPSSARRGEPAGVWRGPEASVSELAPGTARHGATPAADGGGGGAGEAGKTSPGGRLEGNALPTRLLGGGKSHGDAGGARGGRHGNPLPSLLPLEYLRHSEVGPAHLGRPSHLVDLFGPYKKRPTGRWRPTTGSRVSGPHRDRDRDREQQGGGDTMTNPILLVRISPLSDGRGRGTGDLGTPGTPWTPGTGDRGPRTADRGPRTRKHFSPTSLRFHGRLTAAGRPQPSRRRTYRAHSSFRTQVNGERVGTRGAQVRGGQLVDPAAGGPRGAQVPGGGGQLVDPQGGEEEGSARDASAREAPGPHPRAEGGGGPPYASRRHARAAGPSGPARAPPGKGPAGPAGAALRLHTPGLSVRNRPPPPSPVPARGRGPRRGGEGARRAEPGGGGGRREGRPPPLHSRLPPLFPPAGRRAFPRPAGRPAGAGRGRSGDVRAETRRRSHRAGRDGGQPTEGGGPEDAARPRCAVRGGGESRERGRDGRKETDTPSAPQGPAAVTATAAAAASTDEGLSAPDPGPDARRGAPLRAPGDAGGGPPAGTAGDRLSEANRGSRGAAVSFRLGGILT
nr:collagen alpha-1(I) chain-like [Globicephala melas]